ncbi:hypothetical protein Cme02nite_59330 [Catellatospora methionotrophica]|uniref:Uncharacterized protein n=1 Tax=Catellatospora methionotrophica TaxID=121620 RepID=A0A8J3LLS1_9ACTN|nr:hypothetical protein [Catellatospora methionotrophica]GIG17601.1 hypothetical protein Cme02nite_59330 [Catellatospora methionotrophica]
MTIDDLRRQLADAYGQERFTMTVADIERRRARVRRRLTAWAVTGAVVLLAAGLVAWPSGRPGRVEPAATPSASAGGTPAWRAGFAAACAQKWAALDHSSLRSEDQAGLPPLLVEQFDGELGIRFYGNDWLTVQCQRTVREVTTTTSRSAHNTRNWLSSSGNDVFYIGSFQGRTLGSEAGPQPDATELVGDYLVGGVPGGATAITAVAPDGRRFRAQFGGGYFLVWAPQGGLQDAVVQADVGGVEILAAGGSPLPGGYDERSLDQACRDELATAFAAAGPVTAPPRRFVLRGGGRSLHLYGSANTVVACTHHDDVVRAVVTRLSRYASVSAWPQMKYFVDSTASSGWLFGVAPAGATGGTVTLAGGRKVPLDMSQGWFAGQWTTRSGGERPVRVDVAVDGKVVSAALNGAG